METVGKRKRPRARRSFTPEFKAEIVELCQRGDRSVGQVACDFDLTETAVREWVRQADVDAGSRPGLTSAEREGTQSAAAGEPPVAAGRRDPPASDGFLRVCVAAIGVTGRRDAAGLSTHVTSTLLVLQ